MDTFRIYGLCFCVLLQHLCNCNTPEGIILPIGAIFEPGDEQAKTAFRYAQSKYNLISTNPFALASYIDLIDVSDSFTLASRMCERMASGVFLFFGVKDMKSLDIVQSFTRTFHMPYLSPSTPTYTPGISYEINMKPDFSYAIIDMILYFEWTKIHYVYDSDEGLNHIQEVLTILRKVQKQRRNREELHVNVLARRINNIENAHDELRQLDRMFFDPSLTKVIVFDLSSEKAYKHILRQIPEVGMNKEGYHYLLATLDFANLDMGRYLHGGVNITGFQLLDVNSVQLSNFTENWKGLDQHTYPGAGSSKLTYEAALAVDAIEVITRALKGMVSEYSKIFQSTFRRKEIYNYNLTRGIPCTTVPPRPWMHGDDIMRHIKTLDFEGLTGRVRFDHDGYRTDFKLDVYTVGLDTAPTKIGYWTPRDHFRSMFFVPDNVTVVTNELKPKIVTSIISAPFLEYEDPKNFQKRGTPPGINDYYKGFCKDLMSEIAEEHKFEFVIKLVNDSAYGADLGNGTWDGMVGELMRNEADLCVAPLTITYDRESVIDFSKPFMNFGISIMIKKPEIMKPGVFSFMEPLETNIWLCIVIAYCAVSVGLFLVSRFSPFEWRSLGDGQETNKFNMLNALWFSMGALMLQGSDQCPRSFSGRVIGTVWWFFVLIIISSYTANLAAFLTIERMQTPIESADDLSKQTEIKYGTLASGSTKSFFENSKVPVYDRMWNFMKTNPSYMVKSPAEGIERVKKSKGKYAFLLESPTNEYNNNKEPCDTMKVGPNLNSKGFGVATPKNSDLREKVNLAVLSLMEQGVLLKLKPKWWKENGVCANEGESSGKRELSLSNVAGIFYILVGGLAMAVILASVEFILTKSKFLEKTSYLRATETVTTLLGTPTAELENGDAVGMEHTNNKTQEKEESTYNYGPPPVCIGFEQYTYQPDHTEL